MSSAQSVVLTHDRTYYEGRVVLPAGGASLSTTQSNASAERGLSLTLSSDGSFSSVADAISAVITRWCSATGFEAGLNHAVRLVTASATPLSSGSAPINTWVQASTSPRWGIARPASGLVATLNFSLEFSANVTFPSTDFTSGPWLFTFTNSG